MIVVNRRPTLLGLPPVTGSHAEQMLLPGRNEVPDAAWQALQAHPGVQRLLRMEWLVLGDKAPKPETLVGLTYHQAEAWIVGEQDVHTLAKWHESARRPDVKEAIKRQGDIILSGRKATETPEE